jgi:hypothetical protein
MKSAAQVIDALGGSTAVAHFLSSLREAVPATTVASWKARNSIPSDYWIGITRMAEANQVSGITLDLLARLADKTNSPPTAPDGTEADTDETVID